MLTPSLNSEKLTLILVSPGGDIPSYHAIRANPGTFPDCDWAEDPRPRSNYYSIKDCRMALAFHIFCGAQRHIVINHYIISDYRSFTDYDAHSMINKESPTNLCSRMNLDTGHSSNPVRINSRQQFQSAPPQKVSDAMAPDRVDARKCQRDFKSISR
jgi:hypothetical protein